VKEGDNIDGDKREGRCWEAGERRDNGGSKGNGRWDIEARREGGTEMRVGRGG